MQIYFDLRSDVSAETKRTARNLLVASAVAIFSVVTQAKLHELFLLKGVLSNEAHAHYALLAILLFFSIAHWLNLRTDLAVEMERRHEQLLKNAGNLAAEANSAPLHQKAKRVVEIMKELKEPTGVDYDYTRLHYSRIYSYYYRGATLLLGITAIIGRSTVRYS